MSTQKSTNIKQVLNKIPIGSVVTAGMLRSMGVSNGLARNYVKSGWLSRVSNGAYTRLEESADLDGALYALQEEGYHIHRGGRSALADIYGKMQYIRANTTVHLFAPKWTRLPKWFVKTYGSQYKLHLTDFLPADLGMVKNKVGDFYLEEPSLERSFLELCYMVPSVVSTQEAFEITETIQVLKPKLLQQLLEACTLVKAKRLALCFADLANLQWRKALKESSIDIGSGNRRIDAGGNLYKKYGLVMKLER